MKIILAISLLIFGLYWVFQAKLNYTIMETRAMSDAMQLEANLKRWMMIRVDEGKLTSTDVDDLFPENYSLRFGGEVEERNFREMISDIVHETSLSPYPGFTAILLGIAGLLIRGKKK